MTIDYQTLWQCGEALLKSSQKTDLLGSLCRILSEKGPFPLVWAGSATDSSPFEPLAHRGFEKEFLQSAKPLWQGPPQSPTPPEIAILHGEPRLYKSLRSLAGSPWADEALKRGYSSSLAFPLKEGGSVEGVLCLYSDEAGAFHDDFLALLENLGNSAARALRAITANEVHRSTEKRLRRNEATLARAQQIARLGNWAWDIENNSLHWSDEIYRIYGRMPGAFPPSYRTFLEAVHPDDRQRVKEGVVLALEGKKRYNLQFRIVQPGGNEKVVHEIGEVHFNSRGIPLRMVGTMQDITRLQVSEDRLKTARKIFEKAIEGVLISDQENKILFVNKAFSTITGYSPEEVIGKNPRMLRSERQPFSFYKAMWEDIVEKGEWEGEIWNRKKSGEAYLEWLSITTVIDDWGKIRQYVAVFHDITEIRQTREKLIQQKNYDALTGLPNRNFLIDRLNLSLELAEKNEKKIALFFLNVDRLKNINESLGYTVGDSLLKEIAVRLKGCIERGEILYRWGGDEFVMSEYVGEIEGAISAAQKVLDSFASPLTVGNQEIHATVSIGIALFPEDGREGEMLIINATTAMHRAKEEGKNRYHLYSPELNSRAKERLHLERGLRKALEQGELRVFYQPKIDIKGKKVSGMEALVRWEKPGKGLVPPFQFIPLAEETGLVSPMGEFVLREACRHTIKLHQKGWKDLHISVNLSTRQFQDQDLISLVSQVLEETSLPPHCLDLEITESIALGDMSRILPILKGLCQMGVTLSVDDFGTGYSSLSYLKKLPVNSVKIDQSFVRELDRNCEDGAIVSAIISMGHSLGLKVIAEGVENREALCFLKEKDCDMVQGYFFSPPLPEETFSQWLGKNLILSC